MKKGIYYFWFIFLGVMWVWVLSGVFFRDQSLIATILCFIILSPVTARVVYQFLVLRSNEKDEESRSQFHYEQPQNPGYQNQMFQNGASMNGAPTANRFCSACGTPNAAGAKFCAGCGKPL